MGRRWAPKTNNPWLCCKPEEKHLLVYSRNLFNHDASWLIKGIHLRKYFTTPTSHGSEKTRSKISSWVYRITRIEAHGEANDKDAESHRESLKTLRDRVVVGVHNGQDAHNQGRCAYHLSR